LLRKIRIAEFLDDGAQIFIFVIIFQSIAPKFCNRALSRQAVQRFVTQDLASRRRGSRKVKHFAPANHWHAGCKAWAESATGEFLE